ncbi:unnamed protein product [Linum trigynum]|uniref:Dof zinc finger protein n=1 Tax=Linum trigynum TaxID=586398 RepID=A0AAV2EL67_9ROSI
MDTAQWPQEIVVKPLEDIVTTQRPGGLTPTSSGGGGGGSLERKARPQKEQALNCPRCNSTNTKFCYYNNYSLTQPRYFCKTCRRYWTEGGSLRNIPVGGGSRKNKRPSSSSSSSSLPSPATKKLPGLISSPAAAGIATTTSTTTSSSQNPNPGNHKLIQEGQDLNLAFPRSFTELIHQNGNHHHHHQNDENKSQISAMELLTGISSSRGGILNNPSFMHMAPPPPSSLVHHHQAAANHGGGYNASGLSFPVLQHQDHFKPSGLSFSLDGIELGISSDHHNESGNGYHHHNDHEGGGGGRPMFSFEDLKQVPSSNTNDSNGGEMVSSGNGKDQHADSSGYWTGMLGGGSW